MSETTTTTRVHVLRHGEVHNPNGVLYGRLPDYHLSVAQHVHDRGLAHRSPSAGRAAAAAAAAAGRASAMRAKASSS